MHTVRCFFQHHMNPLHVYCRLRSLGMHNSAAFRVCSLYEKYVYRFWMK